MPDTTTHHPPVPPALVLGLAIFGISVSGPLVRLAHAPPLTIAAWRLGFSLCAIAAMLVYTGTWRQYRRLTRGDVLVALAAGASLALHFWSWIASISYTSVAASVVLVNLSPVIVALGSAAWLHERPTRAQVAGIAIALAGAVLLAWGDAQRATPGAGGGGFVLSSRALFGDLLAIAGAVTVSGYLLVGRRVRQKLDLWPYVGLVYGACFVCVVALAAAAGQPLTGYAPREITIFAGMALGPMLLGHTGFNWALRYRPAYVVSLVALGEPVGATVLAMLLPGIRETPNGATLLGGAVLLAGVAYASRPRRS